MERGRGREAIVARDKRLLGAILAYAASAIAALIQAGIIRSYLYAAVMGNWSEFSAFFGVKPPHEYCLDYCVAELPFIAGWIGIGLFLFGFAMLFWSWFKPAQNRALDAR
jgi:hypothetical protein